MPIFKCSKCGCAENTALTNYWSRKYLAEEANWSDVGEQYKGLPLCSECSPKYYLDGSKTGLGKWHGRFPKEPYDEQKYKDCKPFDQI